MFFRRYFLLNSSRGERLRWERMDSPTAAWNNSQQISDIKPEQQEAELVKLSVQKPAWDSEEPEGKLLQMESATWLLLSLHACCIVRTWRVNILSNETRHLFLLRINGKVKYFRFSFTFF